MAFATKEYHLRKQQSRDSLESRVGQRLAKVQKTSLRTEMCFCTLYCGGHVIVGNYSTLFSHDLLAKLTAGHREQMVILNTTKRVKLDMYEFCCCSSFWGAHVSMYEHVYFMLWKLIYSRS